ncbi:carboxymuconolactone decarboxylase family protein [Vulgatibacter sp.]|uniref:carboxymuconolactone decarboxylase family protein n=1 Tax=Vulgatibacter sp. TaxID=1971226 RepID=UPI003561A81D
MKQRIDYHQIAQRAIQAMLGLEAYVRSSELEHSLIHLVKIRASQINGCAYCIDMHTKEARADGETEQRIYATSVWRHAPFFSERERAALAWTEALTLVHTQGASDELFEATRVHFNEQEIVALTSAIIAINSWNRFTEAFRPEVGGYVPAAAGRTG